MSTDTMLIAEVGSVHDGSFGNAVKLIEAAADCGADAVKFQTHIAAAETMRDAPMPAYFTGEPRFEYFERTGFLPTQWRELKSACDSANVTFLSSPFSVAAVELLEEVGITAYKVPSGEVSNIPLLKRIAASGKPALLSSGMSCWVELDSAVSVLKRGGPLTVLQCSSAYPCPPEKVGLNVIGEMRRRYGCAVGFSDHTIGFAAPFAAAAMGATVIEKHFTFSRLMYGSDARHSMEPADFRILAQGLKEIWSMRRCPVDKDDIADYGEMKRIFEKSVVTARPVRAGARLQAADLDCRKPGDGIPAAELDAVIGRTAARDLPAEHKLGLDDLAEPGP